MHTKMIICLFAATLLSTVSIAEAQHPTKIPRIGYLVAAPPPAVSARIEAFRQRLREIGYVEGKSIMSLDTRRENLNVSQPSWLSW
jgi:putative ABC transport system substrate-binding protein